MRNEGLRAERELCEKLRKMGYWAHDMKAGPGGQPCDVVAIEAGTRLGVLLDSKDCKGPRFPLSRVEANQESAFSYASSLGIPCGFALRDQRGQWHFLPFAAYLAAKEAGSASVPLEGLMALEEAPKWNFR